MGKMDWVLLLVGSNLPIAASILRNKDTNSTGSDDVAADVLDFAGAVLRAVQFNQPIPDLPASLRPKPATSTV